MKRLLPLIAGIMTLCTVQSAHADKPVAIVVGSPVSTEKLEAMGFEVMRGTVRDLADFANNRRPVIVIQPAPAPRIIKAKPRTGFSHDHFDNF